MIPLWRSIFLLALGAATVGACLMSETTIGGGTGLRLVEGEPQLPAWVLDYEGSEQVVTDRERRILPDDTEFARRLYVSSDRTRSLRCSIVLAGADRNSIHRPEVCLPGQGWAIEERFLEKVNLVNGASLDTMVLLLSRDHEVRPGQKQKIFGYYVYWFLGQDTTTASHFTRVFLTSWDPIVRNVNHRWAYVNVDATIEDGIIQGGRTKVETLMMLEKFISEVVPLIWKGSGNAADISGIEIPSRR